MGASNWDIFLWLMGFWLFAIIFTNVFVDVRLTDSNFYEITNDGHTTEKANDILDFVYDLIEDRPIVGKTVPLMQVMTFQYTNQVPVLITVLLDFVLIITMLVGYNIIHPTKSN